MSENASDWSLRRIVRWMQDDFTQRGIASPRLDAELLAAHALGIDRVRLYMDLDRPLVPAELEAIRALVQRRRKREPIAYILGRREFWGLSFAVSPAVLVPRPETELLVEHTLLAVAADIPARVLDLCTGSGCVAVSIAKERPLAQVLATDLSTDALEVARTNAASHQVNIDLRAGDLFGAVESEAPFDIITANPPYLSETELSECMPDVREFEPRMALVTGDEGFAIIRRIVDGTSRYLAPSGRIFMEVGQGQAPQTAALFSAAGLSPSIHRDLAGIERMVEGVRS
jgi:release factor glutamine methyltransferase